MKTFRFLSAAKTESLGIREGQEESTYIGEFQRFVQRAILSPYVRRTTLNFSLIFRLVRNTGAASLIEVSRERALSEPGRNEDY